MKYKLLLLLLITNITGVFASQIDTIKILSKSMNKSISNIVITPNTYSTQKENFPVLYLLHGAGGDHTNWINKVPSIQEYADTYNIIIVCPDGNATSWYFDSPIDPKMKYETYISKELVGFIDEKFNTITNKNGRAITGLSMGGHGAFYLAFKHQDIWGAAGSISGGLDIRSFPNNWSISQRLGSFETNQDNWEKNTVTNMIHLLKESNLKLIFDCGANDFFYEVNKTFHKKLLDKNIPHDYIERPGNHNWDYWQNSIKYQLVFFDTFFRENKTTNLLLGYSYFQENNLLY